MKFKSTPYWLSVKGELLNLSETAFPISKEDNSSPCSQQPSASVVSGLHAPVPASLHRCLLLSLSPSSMASCPTELAHGWVTSPPRQTAQSASLSLTTARLQTIGSSGFYQANHYSSPPQSEVRGPVMQTGGSSITSNRSPSKEMVPREKGGKW